MNIVYTLTVDFLNTLSADMNLVSVWSLRHSNPTNRIILVCDHTSLGILKEVKHKILDEIDSIVDAGQIKGETNYINRFIKTSLINYIDGDFLYLDADTFVRNGLEGFYNIKEDLVGVANHNNVDPSIITCEELEKIKHLDWTVPKFYINGGVLFIKNSTNTRKFYEIYHNKWQQSCNKLREHKDQHCLNSTIEDSGVILKILSDIYNMQGYNNSSKIIKPHHPKDTIIHHVYGDFWKDSIFSSILNYEDINNIFETHNNIWKQTT